MPALEKHTTHNIISFLCNASTSFPMSPTSLLSNNNDLLWFILTYHSIACPPSICSLCLLWVEWTFLPLFTWWASIHVPNLCYQSEFNVKIEAMLTTSHRKIFNAGNEVPTKLLKGLEEHKSGTANKLSGHNTAGIIQKWGAAAASQRSESYKTTADVTAAQQPRLMIWRWNKESDHCKSQCLLDPYTSAATTAKGKMTLFSPALQSLY